MQAVYIPLREWVSMLSIACGVDRYRCWLQSLDKTVIILAEYFPLLCRKAKY
jgi:hypothetical protein